MTGNLNPVKRHSYSKSGNEPGFVSPWYQCYYLHLDDCDDDYDENDNYYVKTNPTQLN